MKKPKRKTLKLWLPEEAIAPYQQCADYYQVETAHLMQSELYGQAKCLTDDVFETLTVLERFAPDKSKQNLQPVILRLSLDVHALLSEVARLLRRRLPALAAELVCRGADTLAGWMEEAQELGTMNGAEMLHYPEEARRIESFARRGFPPAEAFLGGSSTDCWGVFSIDRPAHLPPLTQPTPESAS